MLAARSFSSSSSSSSSRTLFYPDLCNATNFRYLQRHAARTEHNQPANTLASRTACRAVGLAKAGGRRRGRERL
jgi:hypothetical protein